MQVNSIAERFNVCTGEQTQQIHMLICLFFPQLCEVLCECVNSIMMAEVSSEQLLLREQEEGGNEALLLSQVTELLQFMNRLDLASVFECFYRQDSHHTLAHSHISPL